MLIFASMLVILTIIHPHQKRETIDHIWVVISPFYDFHGNSKNPKKVFSSFKFKPIVLFILFLGPCKAHCLLLA